MKWMAVCLLILANTAWGATIRNPDDIASSSTISSDTYILNPGSYNVEGVVTIAGSAVPNLSYAPPPGSTLTINNDIPGGQLTVGHFSATGGSVTVTAGANTALTGSTGATFGGTAVVNALATTGSQTAGLRVTAGELLLTESAVINARGSGTTGNAYGVWTSRLARQTGGRLEAHGGTGTAYGFYAMRGYQLDGGTIDAYGGTARDAYGLYGYAYAITVNNGVLNAYAGTAAGAFGARSNTVVMDGGVINAYGHNGTPGSSTVGSYGLYAQVLRINAGTLNARSDTAATASDDSRGAYFYNIFQSGGTITATGNALGPGGATNVYNHALYAINVSQTGGVIEARGDGERSIGMRVASTLTVSGSGLVEGIGGGGGYSDGLYAGSIVIDAAATGTVTGRGGNGVNAFGIHTGRLLQQGGNVVGQGGGAAGVYASTLALEDGTFGAKGSGTATSGYGAYFYSSITQSGGALSGEGGLTATGVHTPSFTQTGGATTAQGGSGTNADGIRATNSARIQGGRLEATGGSAGQAYGFRATSTLTQSNGTVQATAGTAAGAHGLYAATYSQDGGTVEAFGNGTANAHGLSAGRYVLNTGGRTTADGGSDVASYGLYTGGLDVYGTLQMERTNKQGASVYVDAPAGATLRNGSVLAPVVDLQGDTLRDSGLLQTQAGGQVTIESGARIAPWFVDHRSITKGVTYTDYLFMDTQGGAIDGVFANPSGGLSLAYTTRKDNVSGQYFLSVERKLDIPEVIDMVPCENARQLMNIFDDLYPSGDPLARDVLMAVDHSRDWADLVAISAHIGKTLTPTAYSKLTGTQMRTMELMHSSVFSQLDSLTRQGRTGDFAAIGSGSAYAMPRQSGGAWQAWAKGLYQQSSRFRATCAEFDSPKEKLYGLSAGVGRDFGSLAVTAALNYIDGTYTSSYTDTNVDNYGVTLGIKAHNLVSSGGWFNPWVSLVGGYVYADIDQKTLSYSLTDWKRAEPKAHMGRLSLEAGNDIPVGATVLTPFFGVDFAVMRQDGYRESDPSGYGLCVSGSTYTSLRPRAGVAAALYRIDRFDFSVNASVRYETMDRRSSFTYSRLAAPNISIALEGEDRKRLSGSFGASLHYRLNARTTLACDYDLVMEDSYTANRFSLGIGVGF